MVALSRRTVLGLAGALAVAGCTGAGGPPAGPSPTVPPPPDPLLAELADEVRLAALYDATLARHPALAARLASPRADHAQHVEALTQEVDAAGDTPTATDTPSASASAPVQVPATAAAALAALRAAERAAAVARSAAALAAPAHRAGLLASVAASEATHQLVLR